MNLGDRKKRPKVSKTLPEATDKKSKKKEKNTDEKAENDPEFAEFLEIHSNRQKDKSIWDNDGIDGNLSKTVKKDKIEEEAIEDVEIGEAQDTNLTDLEVTEQIFIFSQTIIGLTHSFNGYYCSI